MLSRRISAGIKIEAKKMTKDRLFSNNKFLLLKADAFYFLFDQLGYLLTLKGREFRIRNKTTYTGNGGVPYMEQRPKDKGK